MLGVQLWCAGGWGSPFLLSLFPGPPQGEPLLGAAGVMWGELCWVVPVGKTPKAAVALPGGWGPMFAQPSLLPARHTPYPPLRTDWHPPACLCALSTDHSGSAPTWQPWEASSLGLRSGISMCSMPWSPLPRWAAQTMQRRGQRQRPAAAARAKTRKRRRKRRKR